MKKTAKKATKTIKKVKKVKIEKLPEDYVVDNVKIQQKVNEIIEKINK